MISVMCVSSQNPAGAACERSSDKHGSSRHLHAQVQEALAQREAWFEEAATCMAPHTVFLNLSQPDEQSLAACWFVHTWGSHALECIRVKQPFQNVATAGTHSLCRRLCQHVHEREVDYTTNLHSPTHCSVNRLHLCRATSRRCRRLKLVRTLIFLADSNVLALCKATTAGTHNDRRKHKIELVQTPVGPRRHVPEHCCTDAYDLRRETLKSVRHAGKCRALWKECGEARACSTNTLKGKDGSSATRSRQPFNRKLSPRSAPPPASSPPPPPPPLPPAPLPPEPPTKLPPPELLAGTASEDAEDRSGPR